MRHKIGILTYGILQTLALSAVQKITDPELEVVLVHGLKDELLHDVLEEQKKGVTVFVGSGANAHYIRERTGVPLVVFGFNLQDFLIVFQRARQMGQRIGIATTEQAHVDLCKSLEQILNFELVPLLYTDKSCLARQIGETNPDVVIGASLAQDVCHDLQKQFLLVYTGEQAIIDAIYTAKAVSENLLNEIGRQKRLEAVLTFARGGILATDQQDRVILCNPAAETILSVHKEQILGCPLRDCLPPCKLTNELDSSLSQLEFLDNFSGVEVVVNRIPILINGNREGTVNTFQKLDEVRHIDRKSRSSLHRKNFAARYTFGHMLGESSALSHLCARARKFAETGHSIYISGETGVGKEVLAQSIHNASPFRDGPFVAVNCAALPDSLLESELFGYEEGAFTGARKGGKAGLFELAHTGTLFLDEVDQISFPLQARLLRALQEKEIMRLGGKYVLSVDIRIISASNTPLNLCVEQQRFRADLLYRLNVFQLNVPPLRERDNDALFLFLQFLAPLASDLLKRIEPHTERVQKILRAYSWPGNIRELGNVAQRFSVLLDAETPTEETVHLALLESIGAEAFVHDLIRRQTENPEKISPRRLKEISWYCAGNLQLLADALKISRTTLWRRLRDGQNEHESGAR